jgi:hypothetical protein
METDDSVKAEIEEMIRSLNSVDDEVVPNTDPPVQSSDESQDKEVKDESSEAKPPTTDVPAKEEDELSKLRSRILELELSIKGKDPDKDKEVPPATDPPIGEKNFLEGVDLDDIRDDPVALNKLLNKIYAQSIADARDIIKHARKETFETLPTVVTEQIELKATLRKMTDEFYAANPDLGKWRKSVSTVFNEVVSENPNMKISDVLRKVGDETRERLGLPKPDTRSAKDNQTKTKDEGDPPPLPKRKGSRVQTQTPTEKGSTKSQIEEMLNFVGRR